MILLTDNAERAINRLKQNFGNAEVIFHHLEENIRAFDIVESSKSFLEFFNLVEPSLHSAILKKLVNKLPDYLKIQCMQHNEE
jgi:hypothetical protein